MKDLLFLTHRIPYPPNKGDKLRSFHLLRHLSQCYRVHLGTFIDDPADWQYVPTLREMCGETRFLKLDSARARLRSLRGLLGHGPLTVPYYYDRALQDWVDGLMSDRPIHRILVFSSAMAQYVAGFSGPDLRRVIDFVDVDSDKWLQYAERKAGPMRWLYRRESRTLQSYEAGVAASFDVSLFVSKSETALFRGLTGAPAERVTHINNGVDADYFSPGRDYPNPYRPDEDVLVFTGAMDYWANVDAVCWFATEVLPIIRSRRPSARFYVVGARPSAEVQRLGEAEGVQVTGTVDDIRPYLAHARAAVAPLRISRGVQNKVLEAMAMAKPVLATPAAMEGIEAAEQLEELATDDKRVIAERAVALLGGSDAAELGRIGRRCVLEHYDWTKNLQQMERLLNGGASVPSAVEHSAEAREPDWAVGG